MGFVSLPAEIRVCIYSHIAAKVPEEESVCAYNGLRLSCRLVKSELDHECEKIISRRITQIYSNTTLSLPALAQHEAITLRLLQHLTLPLPSHTSSKSWSMLLSHGKIWSMNLQSVTFQIRLGEIRFIPVIHRWLLTMDVECANAENLKNLKQQVVLDIVHPDETTTEQLATCGAYGRKQNPPSFYALHQTSLLESCKITRFLYKKTFP
jgi:hypothetical protein